MNDHGLIYRMTVNLCAEVSALVGDDGTGDIGLCVRFALHDNPLVSAREIADGIMDARREAAVEARR